MSLLKSTQCYNYSTCYQMFITCLSHDIPYTVQLWFKFNSAITSTNSDHLAKTPHTPVTQLRIAATRGRTSAAGRSPCSGDWVVITFSVKSRDSIDEVCRCSIWACAVDSCRLSRCSSCSRSCCSSCSCCSCSSCSWASKSQQVNSVLFYKVFTFWK